MVAAAMAATVVVGMAPAASAVDTAGKGGNGITALVFSGTTRAGVQQVITCWGQAQYPHHSSGTPGAIVAKARTWCDAPIAQIEVQTELYRYLDGYGYTTVGIGSLGYALNSAGPVQSDAYDICQGRLSYWAAVGRHRLVAPPGFTPPTISFTSGTPGVGVNC